MYQKETQLLVPFYNLQPFTASKYQNQLMNISCIYVSLSIYFYEFEKSMESANEIFLKCTSSNYFLKHN